VASLGSAYDTLKVEVDASAGYDAETLQAERAVSSGGDCLVAATCCTRSKRSSIEGMYEPSLSPDSGGDPPGDGHHHVQEP
jgi:hypothetical protein